jgi:CDP-glycerol glycerophosphotransferase (TagB/SpsB family)
MRIGIYLRHPFHEAIFASTIAALPPEHTCVATSDIGRLTRLRPHVVLAAEDLTYLHLRAHLPCTRFVHVRHGLASKGVPERSFRAADYVCLTSEAVRDDFLAKGIRPRRDYWITGYVQMDNLLRAPRPAALPRNRRVVLYAPTWHDGLSSLPMLLPQAPELLRAGREDTFVVIKPHPLVQQGRDPRTAPWMEQLRATCRGRANTLLIDERGADIMPWLNAADVLVTDCSSTQLEFLALDRPMVLIDNPERFTSPHFDSSGYEWAWRDMGRTVDQATQLPAAVADALADPSAHAAARARHRNHLFGDLVDGRSGERLAARVARLASTVASESRLRAASPLGWMVYHTLPHVRLATRLFRRMLRPA